ncbi:alpha/beta hydrolase [Aegicerativicinus sediminis]|uniref:alpha/beta hydrolase n=1 Tax=Aegicerativicinus sediminis TaxID=2893202 RepID=UPI001E2DBE38|nr:dienelactone hydrolase family protein [Aegicerativicinus sediminis]
MELRNIVNLAFIYLLLLTSAFGQESLEKNLLPNVSETEFQTIVQFYEYDKNIPLDARVVGTQELDYGIREKIVFKGINNSIVPAYIVIPKNKTEPHPVVALVDGIFGSKERWFQDDSWPKGGLMTTSLVKAGFAVIILDAVNHGERAWEYGYNSPPWPFSYPNEFRQMVIQTATEYRRAFDYLATRSEFETSKIGMLGLSMGALITFELTSIDARIKTAIAGVVPPLRRKDLQAVDVCTFASYVNSSSFLMFMGNEDPLYSMEEAEEIFNRIPIKEKEFVEYNAGHEPPIEYVDKATNWFTLYLKQF